jgi:hypothetical protein
LATLLARPDAVGVPAPAIAQAPEREIVFERNGASIPSRADALWILSQMQHWGQLGPGVDLTPVAALVYRADLLEKALAAGSARIPAPE